MTIPLQIIHHINKYKQPRTSLLKFLRTRCSSAKECDPTKAAYQVCAIKDSMIDPCKQEPSVVIIGSGIAGLSAAQRLAQCGITNFTILEATERPGGRIHSYWLGDIVAEMGAQYIDGACIGNPVYNLAAQAGLLKTPLKRTDISKGIFCTSDGRAIDHSTTMLVLHVFNEVKREARSLFSLGCGKQHGSLFNFLSNEFKFEFVVHSAEEIVTKSKHLSHFCLKTMNRGSIL